MNTIIQKQLDRVETALNTLIESIESYNPSREAAEELLQADDALQNGVKELATHQANHARILALQTLSSTLDKSFTEALTLLADTRAEILSTHVSVPTSAHRQVPHEELFKYARNLSRYTAPPGFKPPAMATTTNGATPSQQQSNGVDPGPDKQSQDIDLENPGLSFLTDPERAWLDPSTQAPWLPWPSADMIARSALAQSQGWIGAVPADAGLEGQGAQGPGGRDEDGDVNMDAGRVVETARRESIGRPMVQSGHREEKPKVFTGLDLYDPDEE